VKHAVTGQRRAPLDALPNPRILVLGLDCFGAVNINYGLSLVLPRFMKGFGLSNALVE
jgi:hypothetical protein